MRDKVVDAYLEKIANGQSEYLSDLLLHLADEILFTPVLNIKNEQDDKETNRIKVATFRAEGRNIVPTFTSEEQFIEWSAGKHQCFSVTGGDLALSLPRNTWLVLNPGHPASCELSPEQVSVVAASDRFNGRAGFPYSDILEREERRATRTDLRRVLSDGQVPLPGIEEEDPAVSEAIGEKVCDEMGAVLRDFAEVEEAYFQASPTGSSHAVIGLLTSRLDAETRFLLIDQIAEISRKHYGGAGAIEVYDDLNAKSSSSWELFKALTPFYTRERQSDDSQRRSAEKRSALKSELRSNLIIEKVRSRSGYGAGTSPGEDDETSPWRELRKKSSKLLGAFRIAGR